MTIEEFIRARMRETRRMTDEAVDPDSDLGARLARTIGAVEQFLKFQESWPVFVADDTPEFKTTQDAGAEEDLIVFQYTQRFQWMTNQEYTKKFGTEAPTSELIRTIAKAWSWHPDYDIAWE